MPQIGWLRTIGIVSVLEAKVPNQAVVRAVLPPKTPGENWLWASLPASDGSGIPGPLPTQPSPS